MSQDKCFVCGCVPDPAFTAKVLAKHVARFCLCAHCGFLYAEDPYWLHEAYESAVVDSDTAVVSRNVLNCIRLAGILLFLCGRNGKYVDIAGGYGLLTRLMRDIGFDFFWSDKYCQNVAAKGFEGSSQAGPVTALTAFEALEHIHDPVEFIQNSMTTYSTNTLVFSTQLYAGQPPDPSSWWYYGFETGQHISFFQARTLQHIADRLDLFFYTNNRDLHMLTARRLPRGMFRFFSSKWAYVFFPIVLALMKSRTRDDADMLLARLQRSVDRR